MYLDETWVNQKHAGKSCVMALVVYGFPSVEVAILLYAMMVQRLWDSFQRANYFLLQSSIDYHSEMNSAMIKNWLKEQLI
jgi:hypothetical protein